MNDKIKFFSDNQDNQKSEDGKKSDINDTNLNPKDQFNDNHKVIHRKDGRLHVYVRQDKYKGELKSRNWVGRAYIHGKQLVYSSGTPELDDAIPVLDKWYDDKIREIKEKEENIRKNSENG